MRKWKQTRDNRIVNRVLRQMFLKAVAIGFLLGVLVASSVWAAPILLHSVRTAGYIR